MGAIAKKKAIHHIGTKQKETLKNGVIQLVFADYKEVKSLLSGFDIPKDQEKVLVVFSECVIPQDQKPSLKDELQNLGFSVLPKKDLKTVPFKTPVPSRSQKQTLLDIQRVLGVTQEEIAGIIGCSSRKIWSVLNEKSGFFKVKSHINNFNQLVSFVNDLLGLLKKESIKNWIKTSQKTLGNKKPLNLLLSGKIEKLFKWTYANLEGQYK